MSLSVRKIELRNFRNYDHLVLDGIGDMTIFVGDNAVGKTNVVEGIQLMTAIESFRHPQISHLIKKGCDQGMVSLRLEDGRRQLDLELLLFDGKRRYLMNGKPKKGVDLKSLCPAVMFNPDDLNLVKGSHSLRRQALDSLIGQLSANHQLICRDYANVIKHKNALLRDDASEALVRSINEMLITCGSQLIAYRLSLFARLVPFLRERYDVIVASRETAGCEYLPSWTDEREILSLGKQDIQEMLAAALDRVYEEERARRKAVVGPHADKIVFTIDGWDASDFASQGQQRSMVLAYKLSELALIKDVLGQQPILILDDVMSELDEDRRRKLVDFMEDGMQVFITTTNLGYFDQGLLDRADVVKLPL